MLLTKEAHRSRLMRFLQFNISFGLKATSLLRYIIMSKKLKELAEIVIQRLKKSWLYVLTLLTIFAGATKSSVNTVFSDRIKTVILYIF